MSGPRPQRDWVPWSVSHRRRSPASSAETVCGIFAAARLHRAERLTKFPVNIGISARCAGESACKRDPVPRAVAGAGSVTIHLSGLPVGGIRRCRTGRPSHDSALLRVGVASRRGRPHRWCALTAPFHPYLCPASGPSAVCSLLPGPRGRPRLALASTLPCGVPTFLDGHGCPFLPRPPGRLTSGGECRSYPARRGREDRRS